MLLVIKILILFIPVLLLYLQLPKGLITTPDHYGHLSQIMLIKKNKNRFIHKRDNFLYNDIVITAQLLHWLLSFFPKSVLKHIKYLPLIFTFLSSLAFLLFTLKIEPIITGSFDISKMELLLIGGSIYVFTPVHYLLDNAKNVGMSARGFGLFLGQLFLYFGVLYLLSGNHWYLLFMTIAALLICLSSVFAIQFILFSAPLLSMFYGNFYFILTFLIGVILYFAIVPKYGFQFVKGRIGHKRFYNKYVASKFILSMRYSIWRDLVWDIWKIIFNKFKMEGSRLKGIRYIYNNSLIIILMAYPFVFPIIVFSNKYFNSNAAFLPGSNELAYYLFVPIWVSLILFIGTSFRGTRFLGEPERYVEFSIPFIALCAPLLFNSNPPILIILVLIYSICFIIVQIVLSRKIKAKKGTSVTIHEINKLINKEFEFDSKIHLLSNRTHLTKTLMSEDRKIFWGAPVNEKVGPFHFNEVYDTLALLNKDMLIPVIKEFEINCFVLDTNYAPKPEEIIHKDKQLSFKEVGYGDDYKLFRIEHV